MKSLLAGIKNLASTPVPFAGRQIQMPWSNPSGQEAQMRAMGAVGTLFAIVSRTSNSTSQVGWKLYRTSKNGERTEVTAHAALDLWSKPNAFMTRQEFVEVAQQHVDLTGESWWLVGRDARALSLPLSLWPVRPDRMAPVPHPTEFISGYVYTGPNGEKIPLEIKDVIFLRMPNPLDPYRGMGPVQSILTDLDSSKYSAEWNRNFFINGAEPGGIIEVDKRLSDDEFDEMATRWNEQHKGVANAHRVAVIEQGKWVPNAFTNKDMQFVELRTVSRDVIREAFGIPPFAVGDVVDVNRAVAEASRAWFAEALTVPRLERIKGALNNDLLPLFAGSAGLEFDYENPVPEDHETINASRDSMAASAATLIAAGFDPDDVLETVGLPPMKFSKPEHPLALVPETADPALPEAMMRPKVFAVLDSETDEIIQRAMDRMGDAWNSELDRLMSAWDRITGIQRNDLVRQVREALQADDIEALSDLDVPTGEAEALLLMHLISMAESSARGLSQEAAEQGETVDPMVPPTVELSAVAATVAVLLASGLATSVGREALRIAGPETTPDQVASAIDRYVRGLPDRGLKDQLGGALMNSANRARFATMLDAPPATWYASERNDRNTCSPCRGIDETRFLTLEAAFVAYPSGGYRSCEGGVRCRGSVVPVWSEVVLGSA